MKITSLIPIGIGIALMVIFPLWAIVLIAVFSVLCARESRRLRTSSQLTDLRWEHDLVSIKRAAFNFRPDAAASFHRPRRMYGPK
jgi:hypothetical protein